MLASILMTLNSFASGFLSGFGISAGVGEVVAASAGFLIFSKTLGKLFSKLIKWFMIFLLGMLLYRHIQAFHDIVNTICIFIEAHLPSMISTVQDVVKQ